MPLTYTAGLVERFGEIAEATDADAEAEELMDRLLRDGLTEEQAQRYMYRRFGQPLPNDEPEPSN